MRRVTGIVVALAAAAGAVWAQTQKAGVVPPGDWQTINRDFAATRYSPLTQINTSNVANLKLAWSFPMQGGGTSVPLAVNGIMYISNGSRVTAIDGESGMEVWSFSTSGTTPPPLPTDAQPQTPAVSAAPAAAGAAQGAPAGVPGGGRGGGRAGGGPGGGGAGQAGGRRGGGGGGPQVSARGLGYWPGDGKLAPRILFLTGSRLWAIDAQTGKAAEGFGENGSVAIGVSAGGVPSIFRNVAIVGASSTENPQEGNAIGNPRAFDVVTGKKLWEFQTVPKAGEKYNDTWGPNGWQNRQGTNMWAFAAPIDYDRGIAYLPISGPAANYYGGDRPGNNVYGNSVVAVDAQTGQYKWHFQTVHHDLWDSDVPSAGALIEVTANGRRSPAIAHVGKTSYFFVLNRENGNPLIPVEERPVPKGDVPTEWYSPTQPFPVRPGPLVPTSFNKDTDMVRPEDTTPEHAAACQATWDREGGFINLGPFTPFMYHEEGAPPKSTIQLPGGTGGVNWGGVAADPNGIVYMNAQSGNLAGWVEKVEMVEDPVTKRQTPKIANWPDSFGSRQPYNRAFYAPPNPAQPTAGKGPFHSFTANGMPCIRPPWGQLIAVNANTGEVLWKSVLGLRLNMPAGKQLLGNSGSAGPTVTAGGVVFVGATNDGRFRAFDAKTGKPLWESRTDGQPLTTPGNSGSANANPMTYTSKSGKQFVGIVAGGNLRVFALP
jgi:glucose dehydrogenase